MDQQGTSQLVLFFHSPARDMRIPRTRFPSNAERSPTNYSSPLPSSAGELKDAPILPVPTVDSSHILTTFLPFFRTRVIRAPKIAAYFTISFLFPSLHPIIQHSYGSAVFPSARAAISRLNFG